MANPPETIGSPKRRVWLKAAMVLLLAVAAYGGAYAALVEQAPFLTSQWDAPGMTLAKFGPVYSPFDPHNRLVRKFFAPAHWVDCKLRPSRWIVRKDED